MKEIQQCIAYLDKGSTFDPRFTLKALRQLPQLYRAADLASLKQMVDQSLGTNGQALGDILGFQSEGVPQDLSPEAEIFVLLVVSAWATNNIKNNDDVERALAAGELATKRCCSFNLRSLDYLEAKSWFYYVMAVEASGNPLKVYPELMATLRTASNRHDDETTSMVIVLLLRILLLENKVSQAANLVSKTTFPETASNSLVARYMFYLARINTVQLDYSTAYTQITQAIRKAPQTDSALGFLQTANKLSVLIELLMGDIPDRETFKKSEFRQQLKPYFALAKAVRFGDVQAFSAALQTHEAQLRSDGNYKIAHRLRQNVIKTGIRVISLTYSKIFLKDMCIKLDLDSEESAEYIVAKAIRDGVIDAEINHAKGFMQSKETLDVYGTSEPQHAFHDRIEFCMTLHDDSVRAMRYLSNDHNSDLKDAEEAREREKELVTEIQEGTDLEDYDGDFDM